MPNSITPANAPVEGLSQRFCATDADIIFQSNDGVLFHIHQINLVANSDGFPPLEFLSSNEIVSLTESSTTLELLFQFIYPIRHPDLELVEFDILDPLSEAAEKYQVFSAMSVCKIYMKNASQQHPERVLSYAVRHGYTDIEAAVAPFLILRPLSDILPKISPNLIIPWIKYHEEWTETLQKALSYRPKWLVRTSYGGPDEKKCDYCGSSLILAENTVLLAFSAGLPALDNLDRIFNAPMPGSCYKTSNSICSENKKKFQAWRLKIEEDIRKIPHFRTFL